MFCNKCGKEIDNEAVICPNCGCATNNFGASKSSAALNHSKQYPQLEEFCDKVKTAFIFGILSLALSMGIGIIFQIINLVSFSKLNTVNLSLTLPHEVAAYEEAKKKLNTARWLTGIGLIITGSIFFISFFIGFFSIMFD